MESFRWKLEPFETILYSATQTESVGQLETAKDKHDMTFTASENHHLYLIKSVRYP
jgi:hypothetical protein